MGFVNNDAVGPQASHFSTKDFDIGPDLLLAIELEDQNCNEEFENIGGVGPIGALDDRVQHVFKLVIVDALVIRPISSLEDGVDYVATNFVGDGICCPFFWANDHLIEEIDAVVFFLGIGSCVDGRRERGAIGEIVSLFLWHC